MHTNRPAFTLHSVTKTQSTFGERIESVKSGVAAAVGGTICFAPYAVISAIVSPDHFSTQWEFNHDMFAVSIALFGITYRYAIRNSSNPQLKLGVIGAFTLTRVLNLIHTSDFCSPIPLNCGFPFYYVSIPMAIEGGLYLLESLLGYGGGALLLDYCFANRYINKFVGEVEEEKI